MKKSLLRRGINLFILISIIFINSNVFANTIYYTNNKGVRMTELEYNKMLKIFSER